MANSTPTTGSPNTPKSLPRGLIGRGGAVIGQSARLPSLRTPRDLTLGGVAKRKYTPTIPVARKEKPKDVLVETDPRSVRNNQNRGRGRGRGFGRGRGRGRGDRDGETIQMPGLLFSEETALSQRRRYGDRQPSTASYSKRPKSGELKREVKVDVENDAEVLKQIYHDDFVDFEEDDEFIIMPGTLPLMPNKPIIKAEVIQKNIKKEVKDSVEMKLEKIHGLEIKKELPDFPSNDLEVKVNIKREPFSDDEEEKKELPNMDREAPITASDASFMSCAELLCSLKELNQEELLLFHLPDTLPAVPRMKDDEKPRMNSQSKSEEIKSVAEVLLADLSEGCMGKLQELKSGKMRLVLGNTDLDVEMGAQVGFLQDLVSLHVIKDGGELSTLDHVHFRMISTPKLDQLFQ